jgi:hypothetical protein
MIKLTDILNEVKIARFVPNNLKQLEQIESQIKSTKDKATLVALAIKAAELVLPIWEYYYPNDNRPRKDIKAAKSGDLATTRAAAANTASGEVYGINYAASYAAAAAASAAYAATTDTVRYAASNAAQAADTAINATKLHFNIPHHMYLP